MAEPARQQPTFDAPLLQMPPAAPTPKPAPATAAPPPASDVPRVFVADRPDDGDAVAPPALARIAELVAHRGAEGPLVVALIGGAGAGKSRALSQVMADALALSRAAKAKTSPYSADIVAVRLAGGDAGVVSGSTIGASLAGRLHAALSQVAPDVAAKAADEANHASGDPHAHLQSLQDSLDSARRRLDSERRARDEAESRRARLVETILYESAGSRVDAYARANRGAIEGALTSFGFTKGDPLATYKGLVHTLADAGGPTARLFASLRALWAYPGQTKRLVWTAIFLVLAWGFGALGQDQSWLNSLSAGGETLQSLANWLRGHLQWFGTARQLCLLAAALCVLSCVWRAVRFSRPLLRGAALVDADLGVRRGELDNLVAHHTQRVEALSGEAESYARRTVDAERRVGDARPATPAYLAADALSDADRSRRAYVTQVDAHLARGGGAGRVLVALDDLDSLSPEAALRALEDTAAALRAPSYVLVAAIDTDRVLHALGPAGRERLERVVQVPLRIDADRAAGWSDAIARLASPRVKAPARSLDAGRSTLDTPVDAIEQKMLATLAPLAGPSPRGVKRFVNLYRLGRQDAADDLPAFAFALALAIGGTADEKAAFAAMSGEGPAGLGQNSSGRLRGALEQFSALAGKPMSAEEARRAKQLAARWSLGG